MVTSPLNSQAESLEGLNNLMRGRTSASAPELNSALQVKAMKTESLAGPTSRTKSCQAVGTSVKLGMQAQGQGELSKVAVPRDSHSTAHVMVE